MHLVPLPSPFFESLLFQIDTLAELKLTLYFFWRLEQQEGAFRYLLLEDILADKDWMASLADENDEAVSILTQALENAVQRGTLLEVHTDINGKDTQAFFVNSVRGRAAVRAVESGQWRPGDDRLPAGMAGEPVNIYRLYEENIGPITPLLAESLSDAEDTYPVEWITHAVRIAVENNKRSWRYIEAILKRWQQEGRDGKKEDTQNRRGSDEDRRSYVEGEYSDFIEH